MRRVVVLALLLPLLMLVQAGPATAGVSCHQINAKGAGQGAPPQAGDPPGLIRTVAQIRGGGLLQGTTEAAFQVTGATPTGIAFAGDITFTTNRATLTVDLEGTLDLATGEFSASGDVSGATGKLDGRPARSPLRECRTCSTPQAASPRPCPARSASTWRERQEVGRTEGWVERHSYVVRVNVESVDESRRPAAVPSCLAACVSAATPVPTGDREGHEDGADRGEDHATSRQRPAHLAGREHAADPEDDAECEDCEFTSSVAHHAPQSTPDRQCRRPIMDCSSELRVPNPRGGRPTPPARDPSPFHPPTARFSSARRCSTRARSRCGCARPPR